MLIVHYKIVSEVLGSEDIWGMDINSVDGFSAAVSESLYEIITKGVEQAIKARI